MNCAPDKKHEHELNELNDTIKTKQSEWCNTKYYHKRIKKINSKVNCTFSIDEL